MAEPTDPQKAGPQQLSGRIGKYEIVRPLGRGAMGQVYLAHDTVLERDVALKVMAAQIADDAELKLRFEREARAVAKMTHPNVVMVFDLGSHSDGSPFIAMELLRGRDLQVVMRQTPPPSLEKKVAIIVQVLAGLAHAHQSGIVHRDIKPANIFIQEDGIVKIMDFGVARLTAATLTGTGNIVGTADYMSPEQVQGAKVDGRSDIFATGCMLFELVTGKRPFHAESLMAIFYKITHEDPRFELVPKGSEYDTLLPLMRKALAREVSERYQTAQEFGTELRDWLKAYATTASSRNVLESLVDLETSFPATPATEAPGATSGRAAGATVELVGGRTGPISKGATVPARITGRGASGPVASGRAVARRPTAAPRARARAASPRIGRWLAAALAVVALAAAGYLGWSRLSAPGPQPSRPSAAADVDRPPSTEPPPTSPAATSSPPVTAAPQPTFAEAEGRAAATARAAQAAFNLGRYDRAVTSAQQALREDPASATAKAILDKALRGQQSLLRARAAEAALAKGDLAAAGGEADAALALAPWDAAAVAVRSRVEAARRQAERELEAKAQHASETGARQTRATETNSLLNEAANAMERKQFDAAVASYNRVLALDPGNAVAQTGKSNALTAKTIAEAAVPGARGGAAQRAFVSGRTQAKGAENASGGPVGFEDSAGVVVRRGTQAAELPGRIVFEASPPSPQPGEKFGVLVYLRNEGSQPIQLSSMVIATTLDGKTQKGSLAPLTRTVAPRDRALVFQVRDQVWREATSAWTMEILLTTAAGDSYHNTLSWK